MVSEAPAVLLADDDDGHASLVEKNLRRAGLADQITRVRNGREAIEFISQVDLKGSAFVVLLDINMPEMDGVEVLRTLKSDPKTSQLPVIMLTTTDDPREILRCYQLGCNFYIAKPVVYEAFVEAVRRLGLFLQVVNLPDRARCLIE